MTADRDGKILGARRHAADRRGGGASRCSTLPVRHMAAFGTGIPARRDRS